MRKYIYVLALSLFLTGCTITTTNITDNGTMQMERLESMIIDNEKSMYIDDKVRDVIEEINKLGENYNYSFDQSLVYINIYDTNSLAVNFLNEMFDNDQYFKEIVEILDKSLAKGLKEHVEEMEKMTLKESEIILRKIGRAVVYTEKSQEDQGNSISIRVNFSDLEDKDYRELLNKVSGNKYILENMVLSGELDMMDIKNPNDAYYLSHKDYLSIRYNLFLEDKNIKKVIILMESKNIFEVDGDDMDVFLNLLEVLDLNNEEKKDLTETFTNILQSKSESKITLENYKVYINSDKGNIYSEKNQKRVYFSIENN